MTLTQREKNIVKAAIHLWKINDAKNFVPDYELQDNHCNLSVEDMRAVRDEVQSLSLPKTCNKPIDDLHDADPNCQHEMDPDSMSGLRCLKCGGWNCL